MTCTGSEGLKFSKQYGIMGLPLSLLILFGNIGCKRGQLTQSLAACICINVWFFVHFTCIVIMVVGTFFNQRDPIGEFRLFLIGYGLLIVTSYSMLFFKSFKNYNLLTLLCEIQMSRRCSLKFGYRLFVFVDLMLVLGAATYNLMYNVIHGIVVSFSSHSSDFVPVTMDTEDPTMLRLLAVVENPLAISSGWMSFMGVNFLIGVTTIILAQEFEDCLKQLNKNISQSYCLSDAAFGSATKKYFQLKPLVRKVDDMFRDQVRF